MREYAKNTPQKSHTLNGGFKTFKQISNSEILQTYKNETSIKRAVKRERVVNIGNIFQYKFDFSIIQRENKNNVIGLPDNLKIDIDNLFDYKMDDLRVHNNLDKHTQLQTLIYMQGTDINTSLGQENYLLHENCSKVQCTQSYPQSIKQLYGMNVNNNERFEKELDLLGERIKNSLIDQPLKSIHYSMKNIPFTKLSKTVQRVKDKFEMEENKDVSYPQPVLEVSKDLFEMYEKYIKDKKESRATARQSFNNTNGLKLKNKIIDGAISDPKVDKGEIRHKIADPLIKKYEAEQIKGATDLDELIKMMEKSCPSIVTWIKPETDQEKFTIKVKYQNLELEFEKEYDILTVYKENLRFTNDGLSIIYKKRSNTQKEYVKAWNDTFVPRYIYRYMNQFDKRKIQYDLQKIIGVGDFSIDKRNPLSLDPTSEVKIIAKNCEDKEMTYEKLETLDKLFNLKETDLLYSLSENCELEFAKKKFPPPIGKNTKNKKIRYLVKMEKAADIAGKIHESECPFFLSKHKINIEKINENIQDGKKDELFDFLKLSDEGLKSGKCYWEIYNNNLKTNSRFIKNEVLSHQRSKEQQGGSGFISCTATKHPIFGSTGQDFYEDPKSNINVVAKIDLSKIESSKIIHTYSKKNMQALYNMAVPNTSKEFAVREDDVEGYEVNAAARDAMRTREIIINGKIPADAIVEVEYSPKDAQNCLFRDYGTYVEK